MRSVKLNCTPKVLHKTFGVQFNFTLLQLVSYISLIVGVVTVAMNFY